LFFGAFQANPIYRLADMVIHPPPQYISLDLTHCIHKVIFTIDVVVNRRMKLKEEFNGMSYDQKLAYVIENLRNIPDDIVDRAINILVEARETEYAVVLARDKGLIVKAIDILVKEGDYLWAALIAKNAGMTDESERLYREGLKFYIDMEMFGRAISAATALKLPPEEVDSLFIRGIEVESRNTNLVENRAMLESLMESLDIALIGREDDISREVRKLIKTEKSRLGDQNRTEG
jgi:hypothetical protein